MVQCEEYIVIYSIKWYYARILDLFENGTIAKQYYARRCNERTSCILKWIRYVVLCSRYAIARPILNLEN